ncbi:MAG: class I SAM-dependent rRNA methyltransferase [Gammaproteobacteria bacterium]|jgi:23S rRNA (cytosine1962-C5)-methyltransferase
MPPSIPSGDDSGAAPSPLRLKKREERRLRAGHLWVYSNEVDTAATPLSAFEPGQPVQIQAHNGKPLGCGYVNPHSLICARLVSRDPSQTLGRSLLVHRLNVALSLRERLFDAPCYRLVYGEGDALPGLVVDRFGDVLVVQITTAGMERARDHILDALDRVLKPRGILLRNDTPVRAMEGLDSYVEALGEVPESVDVLENGAGFQAPLSGGQKTGWFYDQRDNRARMTSYVRGCRVLDLFSYVGAWGIEAALAGAKQVHCVDASQSALDALAANAERNGVAGAVHTVRGDAFSVLKDLRENREQFDVVILDPPAFIKRRKDMDAGAEAYQRINQMAMQVLSRDGTLISASCSFHLEAQRLQRILLQSSRHLDRSLQLLDRGRQSPDHPVHPAIPETEYLKALYCRLLPA